MFSVVVSAVLPANLPRPVSFFEDIAAVWRQCSRRQKVLKVLECIGTCILASVLAIGIVCGIGVYLSSQGTPHGAPFVPATLT